MWGLSEAALLAGEYGTSIDLTEAALDVAARTGERGQLVPFAVTGTRARLAAGRPAEAARWVDRISVLLEPAPWFASPALDHARGLIASSDGSVGVARTSLERAVTGWERRGRAWERLWAQLDLAACLAQTGRATEAADLVSDVRDAALRLGSRPLIDRTDALLRQVRGRVHVRAPWYPLTARELEVARLIASGRTNAEIAGELGVAPRTASAHVEHILAKLGASRRAEIASWVSVIPGSGAAPAIDDVVESGGTRRH
jgi:DNA-binding CsgD family transcriptional regulator